MSTNPTGSLGFQRWTRQVSLTTPNVFSAPQTISGDGVLLILKGVTPNETQFIEFRDSAGALRGFVGFPTIGSDLMLTRNVTLAGQTNMIGNGEMFVESTGDDVHVVSDVANVVLSGIQIDIQNDLLYSGVQPASPGSNNCKISPANILGS